MADNALQSGTDNVAADELTVTVNGVATASPFPKAQRIKNDVMGLDGVFRDMGPLASMPHFQGQPFGYAQRNFIMDVPLASPAAEALATVIQFYNNAQVATTTTPAAVPAGKALCILGMSLRTASLAAGGMVVMRLKAVGGAGPVAPGSPTVASLQVGSRAAVAALQDHAEIMFPGGLHFPAGTFIGLSHQGYVGSTGTLQSFTRMEAWGYEYSVA